jgi:hypothetical protein
MDKMVVLDGWSKKCVCEAQQAGVRVVMSDDVGETTKCGRAALYTANQTKRVRKHANQSDRPTTTNKSTKNLGGRRAVGGTGNAWQALQTKSVVGQSQDDCVALDYVR